ncbi:MAG: NUDIX hydrolase [Actinomycetaceae bacterium]|nr:NUDIX hydrolase [Actinomycetaceae bacterium]
MSAKEQQPEFADAIGVYRTRSGRQLPIMLETSAGGLVVSVIKGEAHVACISRRNRAGRLEWCLPKGHLEGEETPAQTAVREIAEETGITGKVICHLSTIDYSFTGTDRRVHKVVHLFLLEALSGELTTEADPDQEAESVAWIPLMKLSKRLAFPNERRVARIAAELLVGRVR